MNLNILIFTISFSLIFQCELQMPSATITMQFSHFQCLHHCTPDVTSHSPAHIESYVVNKLTLTVISFAEARVYVTAESNN